MPFRLDEYRAKIQFTTSARMPYDVYQACLATGCVSNTRYVQEAVCARLAVDLAIPLAELLAALPEPRGPAGHVFDPEENPMNRFDDAKGHRHGIALAPSRMVGIGPANTDEEVR